MRTTYITRIFTLTVAVAGLFVFGYYVFTHFPDLDPAIILGITLPDMVFFYLAYRTYPHQESPVRRKQPRF